MMSFFYSSMTSVSNNHSQAVEWIAPEEQVKRLQLPVARKISDITSIIPPIAQMIAEYADAGSTDWYRAYKRLGVSIQKVPPLPENMSEILESRCFRSTEI
jgi:hypothetical protein